MVFDFISASMSANNLIVPCVGTIEIQTSIRSYWRIQNFGNLYLYMYDINFSSTKP